ncbi:MAG: TIR domain-containing protein, partial [Oscillospiraceae bacterium]|nr:TIR domain-containing protein [Oscillospiraceae bacterium]
MAILKCKMCGGDLEILPGQTVAECDYCGSRQTVPTADNEKKITLFSRANRLRAACDFDKAAGIYESIVTEFPQEAESYWGLVLCKYGIEYVDDPASGKKIPTCHRSSFDSVMDDNNLELALEYADAVARRVYREEAKQIEQIRKGIIAVSANEEPYDIFICYKETDENGERTLDSVLAQDIYDALTEKKYKVFFARITLEEKLGQEYEPYIFAALNSAKIMLVVGTDYDYFHAVWVKNEWSRYLKLMAADKSRHLIPCYKGIDAYDMPKEFSKLQAQDLGKLGAMQDLMRGVQKLLPKEKQESVRETIHTSANSATAPLLRRMFLFLEEGNWKDADSYAERVLDLNPECAEAYLGKLMAERKVTAKTELEKSTAALKENSNYKNALRFADSTLKSYLQTAAKKIDDRIDNDRKSKIYEAASYVLRSSVDEAQLKQAAADFNGISDYRDAAQQREKCLKKISDMHRADIYAEACSRVGTMRYSNYATSVRIKAAEDAISLLLSIIDYSNCQTMYNECLDRIEELRAQEQMEKEAQENERIYQAGEAILMSTRMITDYLGAAQEYAKIPDYKDAREKREVCLKNHREYVIRSVNDWMELAMDVNRPMQGRMQLLQDSISRLEEEQQYVPEAAQLQDKAHQMIVQLQEQERAEELAREDRRKAERKEKYRKMLQTAKDSEDLNSMREAKVWFEAQGDYQDSKALAKHCASRIVDLEQKALEAEKAAIAERIRQQEIARREAAKKEKKQRMF